MGNDNEKRTAEIIHLFKDAQKDSKPPQPRKKVLKQSAKGNNNEQSIETAGALDATQNIVGNNNKQYIKHETIITPKVTKRVQPSLREDDDITEAQAFDLKKLVDEIAEAEAISKKKQRSPSAIYTEIWTALKGHMKVTEYKKIKASSFEKAKKFLQKWLASLTSTYTYSKKNNEGYRNGMYKAIHAAKNTLGWSDDRYRVYLNDNYGVTSSTELDDKQLKNLKVRLLGQIQYWRNKR